MRIVLDANVIISAIISPQGTPAKVLRLWEKEKFELVISPPIFKEIERVIRYPKIQKKYNLSKDLVKQFLRLIGNEAIIVKPSAKIALIKKDPSDNRYLECAAAARAFYIITGDKHLLKLKEYKGIIILNPAGFLSLVRLGLSHL